MIKNTYINYFKQYDELNLKEINKKGVTINK